MVITQNTVVLMFRTAKDINLHVVLNYFACSTEETFLWDFLKTLEKIVFLCIGDKIAFVDDNYSYANG